MTFKEYMERKKEILYILEWYNNFLLEEQT
jgi:hypothetical protein